MISKFGMLITKLQLNIQEIELYTEGLPYKEPDIRGLIKEEIRKIRENIDELCELIALSS